MPYLLDTDICIDVLRGRQRTILRMSEIYSPDCSISVITLYELFCGLANAKQPTAEQEKIHKLTTELHVRRFDDAAARCAADIRARLQRRGALIGPYDLLIAGHALASGCTLVTKNVREFQRIDELPLESWD